MDRGSRRGHAVEILSLVTESLRAVNAAQSPRQLICSVIGRLLESESSAYVSLDVARGDVDLVISSTDPEGASLGAAATHAMRTYPWQTVEVEPCPPLLLSTASCSLGVRGIYDRCGCTEIACLPLTRTSDTVAGLVFARSTPFPDDALDLLAFAQGLIGAIEVLLLPARPSPGTRQPSPLAAVTRFGLTTRELEVLHLLSDGLLARTIAAQLSVSSRTVHHHLGSIYDKLGVRDRLAAVLRARAAGLIGDVSGEPDGRQLAGV